ncbi:hypothetical protein K438DRAFT_1927811 [Mycena galopus ATCC 62051]|nr:hypothetical protein K438DRAFT_1927811 [Mycena galopus ATCC 62051]
MALGLGLELSLRKQRQHTVVSALDALALSLIYFLRTAIRSYPQVVDPQTHFLHRLLATLAPKNSMDFLYPWNNFSVQAAKFSGLSLPRRFSRSDAVMSRQRRYFCTTTVLTLVKASTAVHHLKHLNIKQSGFGWRIGSGGAGSEMNDEPDSDAFVVLRSIMLSLKSDTVISSTTRMHAPSQECLLQWHQCHICWYTRPRAIQSSRLSRSFSLNLQCIVADEGSLETFQSCRITGSTRRGADSEVALEKFKSWNHGRQSLDLYISSFRQSLCRNGYTIVSDLV